MRASCTDCSYWGFTPSWERPRAAGGGGVGSGGGAVIMPMVGLEQQLGSGLSLQLKGGRLKSWKGTLDTATFELACAYRFGLLGTR